MKKKFDKVHMNENSTFEIIWAEIYTNFNSRFIKSNTNRKKQAYYIIHGITSLGK